MAYFVLRNQKNSSVYKSSKSLGWAALMILFFQNCAPGFDAQISKPLSDSPASAADLSSNTNAPTTTTTDTDLLPTVPTTSSPSSNSSISSSISTIHITASSGSTSGSASPSSSSVSNPTASGICSGGFHLVSGSCISNQKTCTLNSQLGMQFWNSGSWGACTVCGESMTPLFSTCENHIGLLTSFQSFFKSCWKDGLFSCPITTAMVYIGMPNKSVGNYRTEFLYPITFSGTSSIQWTTSDIRLTGKGSFGCKIKIVDTAEREKKTISISGCQGTGSLDLEILEGVASDSQSQKSPRVSSAQSLMINNNRPKVSISKIMDNEYSTPSGAKKFDFYFPSDYQKHSDIPTVIYMHGGAWMSGDKSLDSGLAENMAEMGFFVVNTNYSLATGPSKPYPQDATSNFAQTSGLDDINYLLGHLRNELPKFNGSLSKISIMGISAGGHMALQQSSRSDNSTTFLCTISIAGPTDLNSLHQNSHYAYSKYLVNAVFGKNPSDLNRLSPAKNVSQFKTQKLFIVHQIQDNLVPIDQALRLEANVRSQRPDIHLSSLFFNHSNSQPLFNPSPEQATHVNGPDIPLSYLTYIDTECR